MRTTSVPTLTVLAGLYILTGSGLVFLLLVIITKDLLELALEFLEERHLELLFDCVRVGRKIEGWKPRNKVLI